MTERRIFAFLVIALSACSSVTSPVLRAPHGRPAQDVSRDMAECEAVAEPGVTTYAKATGQGLLARFLSPVVAAVAFVAGAPAQSAPDPKSAMLGAAGMGAALGLVAGPVIAADTFGRVVTDERQALFERCLAARGYTPPSTDVRPPRLLVLLERDTASPTAVAAFTTALQRRGYVLGKTLQVEVQWWDDARSDLTALLTPPGWDIIVAGSGDVALGVQQTVRGIPIILAGSELDPVAAGLATSWAEPRGSVSGTSLTAVELNEVRLQLLLRAAPDVTRVAVLANPENRDHSAWVDALVAVVGAVALRRTDVRADTDLEEVFRDLTREEVEALIVLPDPGLRGRRAAIASLARRERLPAIAGDIGFADAGGLLEYHPALVESWREAAGFVDRILKGATVGKLPIRMVVERDLVINLSTAKTLGLALPSRVILSATRVVR